jgi:hypothetical protein
MRWEETEVLELTVLAENARAWRLSDGAVTAWVS